MNLVSSDVESNKGIIKDDPKVMKETIQCHSMDVWSCTTDKTVNNMFFPQQIDGSIKTAIFADKKMEGIGKEEIIANEMITARQPSLKSIFLKENNQRNSPDEEISKPKSLMIQLSEEKVQSECSPMKSPSSHSMITTVRN